MPTPKLQDQFDALKADVDEKFNKILGFLNDRSELPPPPTAPTKTPPPPPPKPMHLPVKYQSIFEKYFDPDDGFAAELDGVMFEIYVPDKFSNITDAHKKFYKFDFRTKRLPAENLEQGLEDWCRLVAQNLHYNRNIATK